MTDVLIFRNVIRGVPVPDIAAALGITVDDVRSAYDSVLQRIVARMMLDAMPHVDVSTPLRAWRHRVVLLSVLDRIDLSSEPTLRPRESRDMAQIITGATL